MPVGYKELIDSSLENLCYEDGRRSVKEETWAHCGEGAKRVADYLLDKYEQLTQEGK